MKKAFDPRFSDICGKVDEKIFAKNYSFLDDYREEEITKLTKVLKRVKSETKKVELKEELTKFVQPLVLVLFFRMKQQATERKRGLKIMEKLEMLKGEEKEKIKNGKKPFFLKSSAIKAVGLEEK